jgi:hypothetical protein
MRFLAEQDERLSGALGRASALRRPWVLRAGRKRAGGTRVGRRRQDEHATIMVMHSRS